ncbi:hypothetical protein Dimus_032239, partial [Dionaea muscipula]
GQRVRGWMMTAAARGLPRARAAMAATEARKAASCRVINNRAYEAARVGHARCVTRSRAAATSPQRRLRRLRRITAHGGS